MELQIIRRFGSDIAIIPGVWWWCGGGRVVRKLPVPGRPTIWMIVGQGPIVLAVVAGGGLFGHFYSPLSFLSAFFLSLGDGPR